MHIVVSRKCLWSCARFGLLWRFLLIIKLWYSLISLSYLYDQLKVHICITFLFCVLGQAYISTIWCWTNLWQGIFFKSVFRCLVTDFWDSEPFRILRLPQTHNDMWNKFRVKKWSKKLWNHLRGFTFSNSISQRIRETKLWLHEIN